MDFDVAGSYNVQKYPWFSPHFIILAMSRLTKLYGSNVESKGVFKLPREMFNAAVALLGVYELNPDNKYFLQPNLQSGSPDVVAGKETEIPSSYVILEKTNLEIVDMNDYSGTDDVVEFLKKTKLSPKKSYDSKTLIVCVINKRIQINRKKIADELKEIKPKLTVYILGKLLGNGEKWTVFSPYPHTTQAVIYNLSETMKKYSLPSITTMHRKAVRKITHEKLDSKLTTTVYEVFNLKKPDLEKYKIAS